MCDCVTGRIIEGVYIMTDSKPDTKSKKSDATFTDTSLYGSRLWCAVTLGRTYEWMMQGYNKAKLSNEGFPKPDPINGRYIKADVIAWINRRRQISDRSISDRAIMEAQKPRKSNLSGL